MPTEKILASFRNVSKKWRFKSNSNCYDERQNYDERWRTSNIRTQVTKNGDEWVLYDLANPETVNKRRAEMGFEPLEDYLKRLPKLMTMKIALITLIFVFGLLNLSKGQTTTDKPSEASTWTEADRKYLLDNLIRSKEEIIAETKNLTKEQWNFKESPDRWSINQIIEHICFWELIQMNEISVALRMGPLPQIPQNPDSIFIDSDPKRINKNIATDYTKPFTYSVPLGNNEGKNNIIWYTKMRDESIEYLKSTNDNLRLYRVNFGPNIHQHYMMFFRHSFRHLGQIREIKKHSKYPK